MAQKADGHERSGEAPRRARDETIGEIYIPDYVMRDYEALEKASEGAERDGGRERAPT